MRITRASALAVGLFLSLLAAGGASPEFAVGPQYDTTHVYVAHQDFDRFVASLIATFGGTATKQGVFTVTPTPSSTMSQLVLTPAGSVSVFGFKTPIPYPFGAERTGYLVTDLEASVKAAQSDGADVVVAPFNDPIGRDAVVQWPGGVNMQLYWHTAPPSYAPLKRFQRIAYTCRHCGLTSLRAASWRSRTGKWSRTSRMLPESKSASPPKRIAVFGSARPSAC